MRVDVGFDLAIISQLFMFQVFICKLTRVRSSCSRSRKIFLRKMWESVLICPATEPVSPLSSTGNGSPYSLGSDTPSPLDFGEDTVSSSSGGSAGVNWSGKLYNDCLLSAGDLEGVKAVLFGNGSLAGLAGGTLPALHEWSNVDFHWKYFQQQQQHQQWTQNKFIFPEVMTFSSGEGTGDGGGASISSGVTTSSVKCEVTSSTSGGFGDTKKPFSCRWIDCRASFMDMVSF